MRSAAPSVVAILAVGAALRIVAAFVPGSLQFDELATALNVTGRAWGELLEPLGHHQVAPLGFIAAERLGVALLGAGEAGLRLFPLVASIASLALFWRVAARFLTGSALAPAVALFAVSPALVWYARKAKQYAGDVFSVLVLLLLALRLLEGRYGARRAWLAGALGGLVILVSQPAMVVAAGLFVALVLDAWRGRKPLGALAPVGILWGLGAAIQLGTTTLLTPTSTRDFMADAWDSSFMPFPWGNLDAVLWLPTRLFHFAGFTVGLMRPDTPWETAFVGLYMVLATLGSVYLIRHAGAPAMLLFMPLVIAILLSALRILPLAGRVMLYVGPTLVVACILGLKRIEPWLPLRSRRALPVFLVAAPAVLLPFLLWALARPQDADRVLQDVREGWRSGDVMYVYQGAVGAMEFYGEPLGLTPWIAGRDHGPDVRAYLSDVDTLRGSPRAWYFYTHGMGCGVVQIRSYLEAMGTELTWIDDPHGLHGLQEAAAGLYDLSVPDRLEGSSAATHPLLERRDPRCRGAESTGAGIRERLRDLLSGAEG